MNLGGERRKEEGVVMTYSCSDFLAILNTNEKNLRCHYEVNMFFSLTLRCCWWLILPIQNDAKILKNSKTLASKRFFHSPLYAAGG